MAKLNEVKPLITSENRWKRSSCTTTAGCMPTDAGKVEELEKLLRTMKGLLNKFTPEKMAKLTEQFLDLEINSRSDLDAVVDLVFEKVHPPPPPFPHASPCDMQLCYPQIFLN